MQKMSKHSGCGALVLGIVLWWAAPLPVHALPFTPAVKYATSGLAAGPGVLITLGYQFSMSVPFTVDALASWNTTSLGYTANHQVGLWDSGGAPLVSTTVLGNTDPIQDNFQYHSITPMTLGPGTYTIGGENLSEGYPCCFVGIVTVPGFTWIKDEAGIGAGLIYPTFTSNGSCGQNCYLTVDFSIASAVPESSTLILLASGLLL